MAEMVIGETLSQGILYTDNFYDWSTIPPGIHAPVGVTGGIEWVGTSGSVGTAVIAGYPYLTPTQAELQARLRARLPEILQESIEARRIFPDPVQALVDLLGSMPGDYDTWREIIEEPYG